MSYTVLEQFIAGKTPDEDGEDLIADLGSFAVVLDGVTGKDGSAYRGLTGGRPTRPRPGSGPRSCTRCSAMGRRSTS